MATNAATVESYDNTLLRDDLQDAYSMISPEETPFQQILGSRSVSNPEFEWPTLELASPQMDNRVMEGEDDPAIDTATLGVRWKNYTQISDKVVSVSHTNQATDAAAQNIQRLMSQVSLKLRELKRDMEMMLLANVAANPGAAEGATARVTAGLQAWISTNVEDGGGTAANPTYSGTTHGYPDAAATAGTLGAINEDKFNDLIEQCWAAGANPSLVLVHGANKRAITKTFTGIATSYQPAVDKEVVNAIDFYDSDFGRLTIAPTRFLPALNAPTNTSWSVLVLDPEYAKMAWLDPVQRKPLAETGHSMRHLIWAEYGLQIDNEAAHGIYRDTNGLAA